MADDTSPDMNDERYNEMILAKRAQSRTELANRRMVEAQAHQPIDGRLSSTTDKRGYAQLNVRVPLDLKNQVLELRTKRRARNFDRADINAIVEDALRAYLKA